MVVVTHPLEVGRWQGVAGKVAKINFTGWQWLWVATMEECFTVMGGGGWHCDTEPEDVSWKSREERDRKKKIR
jgi:hypothetical protein